MLKKIRQLTILWSLRSLLALTLTFCLAIPLNLIEVWATGNQMGMGGMQGMQGGQMGMGGMQGMQGGQMMGMGGMQQNMHPGMRGSSAIAQGPVRQSIDLLQINSEQRTTANIHGGNAGYVICQKLINFAQNYNFIQAQKQNREDALLGELQNYSPGQQQAAPSADGENNSSGMGNLAFVKLAHMANERMQGQSSADEIANTAQEFKAHGDRISYALDYCAAVFVLTSEDDSKEQEVEERSSIDGRFRCRGAGSETQDYSACTGALTAYDVFVNGLEQIAQLTDQVQQQNQQMEAQLQQMENPNDPVMPLRLMKQQMDTRHDIALKRLAFHTGSATAITAAHVAMPTEGGLMGNCNEKVGGGVTSGIVPQYKQYIDQLATQATQALNERAPGSVSEGGQPQEGTEQSGAEPQEQPTETQISEEQEATHAPQPSRQEEPSIIDEPADMAFELCADGSEPVPNESGGLDCPTGFECPEGQEPVDYGDGMTCRPISNVDGGLQGSLETDYEFLKKISKFFSNTLISSAHADGLTSMTGGAGSLESGSHCMTAASQLALIMNGRTRDGLRAIIAEQTAKAAAAGLAARMVAQQREKIEQLIARLERGEEADSNVAGFQDDIIVTECQYDPSLPQCQNIPNARRDVGFDGLNPNYDFNAGGGITNLNANVDPNNAAQNAANIPDGAVVDGAGSDGFGLGATGDDTPKNSAFESTSPLAKVKGSGGSGGPSGSGGANAQGGGISGGSGGPGQQAAAQPSGQAAAARQRAIARYGKAGGYSYSKNGFGSKRRGKGNPFNQLFGKNKKGANKGGVLNFRELASQGKIGDQGKSLFDMISTRYNRVQKSERLLEYELAD